MKVLVLILVSFLSFKSAYAGVSLSVSSSGPGCPNGTVSANAAPDFSALSVLFDQLKTEIQASPTAITKNITCRVILTVTSTDKVRYGFSASDLRGFASIPPNSRSDITVVHRDAGNTNVYTKDINLINLSKSLAGPVDNDFLVSSNARKGVIWSTCPQHISFTNTDIPGKLVLQIDLTLKSTNNNASQDLSTYLDSLDISGSQQPRLRYGLTKSACTNGGGSFGRN